MSPMNTLADRLKHARKAKGELWTQAHLAAAAGVSTGTIGNLESGARGAKNATASLFPIAKALGVRYEWLESGQGEMTPAPMRELTISEMEQVAGGASTVSPQMAQPGPMGAEAERRLTRLLAVLFQIPEGRRGAALAAATETLLDHLPPPPSA